MEVWKDIDGLEGLYQVSNKGFIRSLGRKTMSGIGIIKKKPKVLKIPKKVHRYINYNLYRINGEVVKTALHRAVAIAFIPNPDNKPEVNHIDGNKLNNNASNLEWNTRQENMNHAIINGLANNKGINHGYCKLTENQVRKIKYTHKELNQKQIAKIYGVHQSLISLIRTGKNWTHI